MFHSASKFHCFHENSIAILLNTFSKMATIYYRCKIFIKFSIIYYRWRNMLIILELLLHVHACMHTYIRLSVSLETTRELNYLLFFLEFFLFSTDIVSSVKRDNWTLRKLFGVSKRCLQGKPTVYGHSSKAQ